MCHHATKSQHFLCLQQMTDIGTAIPAAYRTSTILIQRPVISLILCIKEIQFSMVGISMTMSSIAGRIYTIKEIHTSFYRLQNILRCSDSHQISRLVLRQVIYCLLDHVIHLRMSFTHCKTTQRIAIQIHLGNPFCMLDPDILKSTSLIDPK